MAYSGIVGVPPIMGLYTVVPALVAYAILGTSRILVVGPDTATGLISALTVGALAVQGTVAFNALTSMLAVLVGILFFIFGMLRMGWVAAFVPTPVMRGFIEGLICVTIIGQVPHLIGITGPSGSFFAKLWFIVRHVTDAALAPALVGCLSLAAMLALRHFAPLVPAALVVAGIATICMTIFPGVGSGISLVGNLPPVCPTSPFQFLNHGCCGNCFPVRCRSFWSAMRKHWARPRRRRSGKAATSIRTKNSSRMGPPTY
jgi:MFS superfamily sulfate permease-like transporter